MFSDISRSRILEKDLEEVSSFLSQLVILDSMEFLWTFKWTYKFQKREETDEMSN